MISREEKEDNKLTMICYIGTFNWNIAKLKTKSYEEVEKLYLSMNPPKGLINQEPITLDKDIEEILLCELSEAIDILSFPVKEDNDRNVAINTIRTELSDKNTLINQLLDSEKVLMEDNTKRQEKLNAIKEVVNDHKPDDVIKYRIKQILKGDENDGE